MNEVVMQKTNDVIEMDVTVICPDPGQPRKTFNPDEEKELIESITSLGVMQPIAVRPHPDKDGVGFMIIYGERRYRASVEASRQNPERKMILARVYHDLTEDEIREMQLTENLQRADVHEMEEARIFADLMKTKTPADIAKLVGKTERFVKDRSRLCNLIPKWQEAILKNRYDILSALKVAALPEKAQKDLYDEVGAKDTDDNLFREIQAYQLRKNVGDLGIATWDLDEDFKKLGKCNGCKFNSASAILFEREDEKKVCSNSQCYKQKENLAFDKNLKAAKEDETMIFITDEYGIDAKDLDKMKKDFSLDKILSANQYRKVEVPELVDLDDYDIDNYDSQKEMDDDIAEDKKKFEKEKVEYEKAISTGKYPKAFVLTGSLRGSVIFISLLTGKNAEAKPSSAKAAKEKISSGTATTEDIDGEIKRIQEGEKRKKEIDVNKIHDEMIEQLGKVDYVKSVKSPALPMDRAIMVHLLIEGQSYGFRDKAKKAGVKLPELSGGAGYDEKYFQALAKVTEADLVKMTRIAIVHKYGGKLNGDVRGEYYSLKHIALAAGVNLKAIEEAQGAISKEREARVAEKIVKLRATKKGLAAPKEKQVPAKKKPAKK